MANVRVTHHNGSVETFEDAKLEVVRGGALKVSEKGRPAKFFAPTGWATATRAKP